MLTKYLSDQIEKYEMGRANCTYEGEESCIQGFGGETWGKGTIWKTQAQIILKWIFRKWDGDMEWIGPAQYRDRWQALVNTVMNLWVS